MENLLFKEVDGDEHQDSLKIGAACPPLSKLPVKLLINLRFSNDTDKQTLFIYLSFGKEEISVEK
ncbi:MAG: hypothetical protein IJH67_03300 [Thermoguttaceae bacterium]|nr:hypothetical protein [Thermoguttaceae bacterium]